MPATSTSRRDVFRTIVTTSYQKWPAYDSTPLYNRSSLGGLEEDIRAVTSVWFDHEAHDSLNECICSVPLAYVGFRSHLPAGRIIYSAL